MNVPDFSHGVRAGRSGHDLHDISIVDGLNGVVKPFRDICGVLYRIIPVQAMKNRSAGRICANFADRCSFFYRISDFFIQAAAQSGGALLGGRQVRIEGQCLFKTGQGLLAAAEVVQRGTQIEVGLGACGANL